MAFEGGVTAASAEERAFAPLKAFVPLLLVLVAVAQQVSIGLDTDVSWLLTVGEKLLDGQRLYIDIFEVNPPASVWVYLPGIVVARALGLTAEFATAALVFLLAAASIFGSGAILRSAGLIGNRHLLPLLSAAIFAFVLLAGACFAQREHIALLTLLPFIAITAPRANAREISRAAAVFAGVGAGVTMAIKPHFVLAVLPLVLFLAWRGRSIAAGFRPECWAAAGVVLAYAAAVVAFHLAFVSEALPMLQAVYIPLRNSFLQIWSSPPGLLFLVTAGLALFLLRGHLRHSLAAFPLIAALGFAAAMGVQGKGYLNHWYPCVALGLFALVLALVEHRSDRSERFFGGSLLVVLAGAAVVIFSQSQTYPHLAQLVGRVGPDRPKLIVAGSNLSIGHPLTRWVDGEWVGRRGALWATGAAVELMDEATPQERAVLSHYIDEDRRIFVEDVERGKPDIILVPGKIGRDWVASNPEVRRATAGYRAAGEREGVTLLVRYPRQS